MTNTDLALSAAPLPFRPFLAAKTQIGQRAGGRFMLSDGFEHRCQVREMTTFGATLVAAVRVRSGEHVICYLEQYGRLEGRITRLLDDGFAVEFSAPASKREKLAKQIAQQADQADDRDPQARLHERIEPLKKRVVLRLVDGRHIAAQILNLSRSGAALTCPVPVAVDDAVLVGRRPARVSRVTQRLVAVAFDADIAAEDFHAEIVL